MGKRKLMTINDLYNFCLKNNFYHFNSLDNNEEIHVQLPATFESDKNDDKDKDPVYACDYVKRIRIY